ncbi:Zn(2)-C6 fungal-type domain-containing protein [Mycena chlorophos]|uniref:Zn(2)-C6 fungal-type domain-containing protein n=1 Tax=Mycena chlorophos TaxID=658473 RepID=A0A8H6S8L9_MYCCL|nr:Zn(2)-C6 fungal-type domain-containing protein [Mycena chlorophos]
MANLPKSGWNKSKACVNCKKRKIRCDLKEPQCGQCARSMNFQDCEYVEAGRSTTQILEERIAGMEARIRDLRPQAQETSPSSTAIFLENATQFGYFLNTAATTPALAGTIELWAMHYSNLTAADTSELSYLARAQQATADALSPPLRPSSPSPYRSIPVSHPHDHQRIVIETIQSHVLLATYFFRNMRALEAKYQLGVAVGLVLGAGMQKRLPVESADRVNAFWTVYAMDCCWTAADGSASNFPQELQAQVDVPWPHSTSNNPDGVGTITAFLASYSTAGTSPDALRVKAAILFERATRLIDRHRLSPRSYRRSSHVFLVPTYYPPAMPPDELNNFLLAFTNIDAVIQQFRQSLPQAPQEYAGLLAHVLVCVAAIKLHNPFIAEADMSRQRVLDAAQDVVTGLQSAQALNLTDVDPIMGTLLTTTVDALVSAIALRQAQQRSSPSSTGRSRAGLDSTEVSLRTGVERVLETMHVWGQRSKLMASQLSMLQERYHRLM